MFLFPSNHRHRYIYIVGNGKEYNLPCLSIVGMGNGAEIAKRLYEAVVFIENQLGETNETKNQIKIA